jgi:hypothetical protein
MDLYMPISQNRQLLNKARRDLLSFKKKRRMLLLGDDDIKRRLNAFEANYFEFLRAQYHNYRYLNNEITTQARLTIEEVL